MQLSQADQCHNRNLAKRGVVAEHVNRRLKIWRILAEGYRNRRRFDCFVVVNNKNFLLNKHLKVTKVIKVVKILVHLTRNLEIEN